MKLFTFAKLGRALSVAALLAVGAVCLSGCDKKPAKEAQVAVSGSEEAAAAKSAPAAPVKEVGTFTDTRDGQTYKTAKMPDGKTWMAENLRFKAAKSRCYDKAEANCVKYGRLYDWNLAKTVCPSGWHLPTQKEWAELIAAVGSETAGKKLKAASGWSDNGNGTDDYGFSALPGGSVFSEGDPYPAGAGGYWWTSTGEGYSASYLYMYTGNDDVGANSIGTGDGHSVRCVMD